MLELSQSLFGQEKKKWKGNFARGDEASHLESPGCEERDLLSWAHAARLFGSSEAVGRSGQSQ